MALERRDRPSYAVLWPVGGIDGRGQPTVGKPVQLDPKAGTGVRWNNTSRERLQPNGTTVITDAQVVTDRQTAIGSLIALGRIEDFRTLGDTQPPVAALYQVKFVDATYDLKGRANWFELGCMKYKGSLPNVP